MLKAAQMSQLEGVIVSRKANIFVPAFLFLFISRIVSFYMDIHSK